MSKVDIKGIKENGKIDCEVTSTAVLITDLIEKFSGMCEADIYKALTEIRESAEMDASIRRIYVNVMRSQKAQMDYVNDEHLKEFEEELISGGIKVVEKCFQNHDVESAMSVLKMCKAIGGDKIMFELKGGKDGKSDLQRLWQGDNLDPDAKLEDDAM